jgi:hypothetical protein
MRKLLCRFRRGIAFATAFLLSARAETVNVLTLLSGAILQVKSGAMVTLSA